MTSSLLYLEFLIFDRILLHLSVCTFADLFSTIRLQIEVFLIDVGKWR